MEIKITINKCWDCKHQSHTGAFDPIGTRPVCHHNCVREVRKELKVKGQPIIPHKKTYERSYDDRPTGFDLKAVPKWCPMKNGREY